MKVLSHSFSGIHSFTPPDYENASYSVHKFIRKQVKSKTFAAGVPEPCPGLHDGPRVVH